MPAFVKLLKDSEAEVRTAIAGQIPGMCLLVPCLRSIAKQNERILQACRSHHPPK